MLARCHGMSFVFVLAIATLHMATLCAVVVTSFSIAEMRVVPREGRRHCRKRNYKYGGETMTYSTVANSDSDTTTGSRYICLVDDFEKTNGPYFFALVDQLFEQTNHKKKHIAFLTTQKDLDNLSKENGINAFQSMVETRHSSLDLDGTPEVFVLEDWNPVSIEERFAPVKGASKDDPKDTPTILWLYGCHNAFYTRHLLRTSGFDRWIQEQCASSSLPGKDNCVFVGEGSGALCSGATMDAAKARGDDSKESPELQVYGLNLLGDENSGVVFVDKSENDKVSEQYPGIEVCKKDEIFVWAQPPPIDTEEHLATKFVMAPNRRGTIEKHATLDPLPPLVVRADAENAEGVACFGEPSIDPSRSAQAETIGDSEWWE